MPRKSADQRVEKYKNKLDPDWVKKQLEQNRNSMVTAQVSAAEKLAALDLRVKAVVNDEDIPLFSHVLYLDFAREVASIARLAPFVARHREPEQL